VANVLLALLVSIPLLAQPHAQLVTMQDVLSVLVLDPTNVANVSQIGTEVVLVLPVMPVHSPLLDQLSSAIAQPVTIQTVKLVQVMQLENVLYVLKVMLYPVENAPNAVIPTVTSALVPEPVHVTLVLPVIP